MITPKYNLLSIQNEYMRFIYFEMTEITAITIYLFVEKNEAHKYKCTN